MLIQRFIFILLLFIFTGPLAGQANDGGSKGVYNLPGIYMTRTASDTIPDTKKPEENTPAPTQQGKIKEVPKSRRQIKPVPLPSVPVKPLKIIKPKIIKRTIGILG